MATLEFLGADVVPVAAASGVPIYMGDASAITFVSYEDDGSTILTLTESQDSSATGEQALAVFDRFHKFPGVGGAFTLVTQTAAGTIDLGDDTTNDAVIVTVRADRMSDGFDYIECTVDGGILMAFKHGLADQRSGANTRSPIA